MRGQNERRRRKTYWSGRGEKGVMNVGLVWRSTSVVRVCMYFFFLCPFLRQSLPSPHLSLLPSSPPSLPHFLTSIPLLSLSSPPFLLFSLSPFLPLSFPPSLLFSLSPLLLLSSPPLSSLLSSLSPLFPPSSHSSLVTKW